MIEVATIIAFTVLFLHRITDEGMILQFVRSLCYDFPIALQKPLYSCPVCMTPWYGSLIIWFGFIFDEWHLPGFYEWMVILAIAGGMNAIFSTLLPDDEKIIDGDNS